MGVIISTAPVRSTLTDRHKATRVELNKHKLLIDSVQDYAIFLLDAEGYIQTWNKGAERNKGYTADEIIGKHFSTFYLQRDIDADKPAKELELAQKHGRVEDEDWRVRKDGTQFWANVVITALYDDDGELVGFGKVTRDLTERKNQEDQLRQANIALKEQQRELEMLNISKDEFISLASHQLRTPATTIKQYLGMILEGVVGADPQMQHDFIKRAAESNERQIHIVDNLLKVAQIDAGKVVLNKMPIDIGRLVRSIIDDHADIFDHRHQKLTLDIPDDELNIVVDPTYFRMALENIIDNASKYTPAEGRLHIAVRQHNDTIHIEVKDSGVGISDADQSLLFKKFSRIPNRLSDDVGGTGLGLYWVGKVIELHGGKIKVHSVVDEGTQFTIVIPQGVLHA